PTLGVSRQSGCALLEIVGEAGLAPPVIACDPANGLLVTPYLSGGPWTREDAHEARNVERLARCLRELHALPPAAGVHDVDFRAQAQRLEAELGAACDAHEATAIEPVVRTAAEAAFELLARREPSRAICHNDLHHLNVLDDGERLWLVDWEYGGLGDPIFDLASLACQHEFTAGQRLALLEAYAGASTVPVESLDAACIAFDYVQWLWYRLWAAMSPAADSEYVVRAEALGLRLAGRGGWPDPD
ncbi:MAG TPA: choline/ethanolamine kinase family protein, partial [Steroidobacteraceae bacterium]|nr:choline/ethanolamine kinase family protein [Steroidobacteraceae bacterium]